MYSSVLDKVKHDNTFLLCQYSLPLALTFYLISSLLVVVYAWKSQKAIRGWRAEPTEDTGAQALCRRRAVPSPVYAIVWLIPVAAYLAYVLTPFIASAQLVPAHATAEDGLDFENATYCQSCILFLHIGKHDPCVHTEPTHDEFIKVVLVTVVISVMSSCSVIYYKVGKWYQRQAQEGFFPVEGDGRSRRRLRRVYATARNMVMVIFVCWSPALVLIVLLDFTTWTNLQQRSLYGLYVAQAITVSLQGFLNSMVYAWNRPNFTQAVLGETTPLLSHDRIAFYDESLTSTC
ncbi:uncharacterized protein LOC142992037 isoform X2 [Genypterus blacodes]